MPYSLELRSIDPARKSSSHGNEFITGMNSFGIDEQDEEKKLYDRNRRHYTFLILPYQRGYRWTKHNVNGLFADIRKFSNDVSCKNLIALSDRKNTNSFDGHLPFYCLQTLSVKKINNHFDEKHENVDSCWEVIDGQQRLTTVLIIYELLSAFSESGLGRFTPYTIEYIRGDNKKNIAYEIHQVFKNIPNFDIDGEEVPVNKILQNEYENNEKNAWNGKFKEYILEKYKSDDNDESYFVDSKFIRNAIFTVSSEIIKMTPDECRDMLNCVKRMLYFIWYVVPENMDGNVVFSKINSGSLALTNAELIKSLILSRDANRISNGDNSNDSVKARVKNNSRRYETLERNLEDKEFWAFLTANENMDTRIDFLFEILCAKNIDEKWNREFQAMVGVDQNGNRQNNDYLLFDKFNWFYCSWEQYRPTGTDTPNTFSDWVLKELENIYDRTFEWYNDVDLYHYVGISSMFMHYKKLKGYDGIVGYSSFILKLYQDSTNCQSKEEFVQSIIKNIGFSLSKMIETRNNQSRNLTELQYGSDDKTIFCILWLMSIHEVVNSPDNNIMVNGVQRRKENLCKRFLFSEVYSNVWSIEHIFPQNPEEADSYCYIEWMNQINHEQEENYIGNLTLLIKKDNTQLQNGNFDIKRQIITRDLIGKNSFIPGSTLNAFLLYYNYSTENYSFKESDFKYWTEQDKINYEKAITKCVKYYIDSWEEA